MLFKGNPGTGKTTKARKLAKLYFDMGSVLFIDEAIL